MSTVTDSIPSLAITSCACSRLSGLELRYGSRSAITLSRPSASAARKAVSEESTRSEEHTSELQSRLHLVCRLLLEKKKKHKSEKPTCTARSLSSTTSRRAAYAR